ncbi:AP endonuclease, family 2 [Corynespora cassiicola Philippines]|uniref:AP endonuclease, family 2 n=1 Tax=Corynespora cassiicola Philippines TaxID=1448308 RepID=A0A2T2NRD3_CORCC|nr:AP endonuclease, family 2 [Corynespora cassiicola Philippines]
MKFTNNPAVSTSCLGLHSSHTLEQKLQTAAKYDFRGVEIVHSDLFSYASSHSLTLPAAASKIRSLCSTLNLTILSLCPFENFEGTNTPLKDRLKNAAKWLHLARTLGALHLQVPAQYDPSASTDEPGILIPELQALADLAASEQPAIIIAYEPMSWSTHCSTWEIALNMAERVDRPNFKICIDTFHIATKIWASPYSPTGKFDGADEALRESLEGFVERFPKARLAYVQLSDGERFDSPFSERHPWYREGEAVEFSWSKHGRPFPLEEQFGGYFPIAEMVRVFVGGVGFGGWVSMETFDWRMKGGDVDVGECGERAAASFRAVIGAIETDCSLKEKL